VQGQLNAVMRTEPTNPFGTTDGVCVLCHEQPGWKSRRKEGKSLGVMYGKFIPEISCSTFLNLLPLIYYMKCPSTDHGTRNRKQKYKQCCTIKYNLSDIKNSS